MEWELDPDPTAVEMLELEMVVRDFLTVLNDGQATEIHAFLTEDVVYRPSASCNILGRLAVVSMIKDIRATFDDWHTEIVNVAVTRNVVIAELVLRMRLPSSDPQCIMSFASFHLDGFRISAWHQLHA